MKKSILFSGICVLLGIAISVLRTAVDKELISIIGVSLMLIGLALPILSIVVSFFQYKKTYKHSL